MTPFFFFQCTIPGIFFADKASALQRLWVARDGFIKTGGKDTRTEAQYFSAKTNLIISTKN